MAARRDAPKVAPVIERLVKALVVTGKAVALYPPASNIPRDTAQEAAAILGQALEERPEVRLVISKEGLFHDGLEVFAGESAYSAFALELYNRKLADVRFHSGTTPKDLVSFLTLLKYTPDEIEAAGGFETRLWDTGVGTITVTEARISIIDSPGPDESVGPVVMSRREIDEMLAAAYSGRSRDRLIVARFMGDSAAVVEYLANTYAGAGGETDLLAAAARFAEMAQIAFEAGSDADRVALMHSLGQAFEQLDPVLKKALLIEQVLPEARTNEALAAVVRQMDIDSVCAALVADAEDDPSSREGLARAIRNLSLISMSNRDDVFAAAGAAMRGAGLSEEFASDVLETASPSRLTVRGPEVSGEQPERPAETILKLIDMAPGATQVFDAQDDPEVAAIQAEAKRGITDGDVIMSLVSLVSIDPGESHFASTMSMLEDSLDVLIERGEIDIAADAADALTAASDNEALAPEQRTRLRKAIRRFTKPEDIKTIAHALRLYSSGTPEHAAAERLLDALGPAAIEPLLEQLADEPDMAQRKTLVDLLSSTAALHISELGAHVTDPRWYVVRNVVSILGSTKSSAVLPYMERTIRHPEARVRREVVRALSCIADRMAHELLIAALSDEDAHNVQLAARYLGAGEVRGAIPLLEQVARGDGRGSRATAPRVEAIEALGRMKAVEALPTLESLAGKRSIIGAAKARELRAAAESAISSMHKPRGGVR